MFVFRLRRPPCFIRLPAPPSPPSLPSPLSCPAPPLPSLTSPPYSPRCLPLYPPPHIARLPRIDAQFRGLQQMLALVRYCVDVSHQASAVI
ncbi:metal-sensing transcriptional repressor, partial [Methylobacterium radiotolerans]|uniref:metal-sensing transcriptional repressor n=1 Tax=Methylobacterium radiotolerans TaxID=31998 RepID=UPI0024782381